ncbi:MULTISPECIES: hypothetical protein [Myroides]|uniref:hypothetical protein n=1 Tax=Myroides TaxID=76831 RepID=UPI00130375C6|nr:hypothetical protein [Myroides phaeus]
MQRKKNIARILLMVAFMFTIVFQFVHSYEHIFSSSTYEKEHSSHAHFHEKRSDNGHTLQLKEHHGQLEKCFACDVIITPYIQADIMEVDFVNFELSQKVQDLAILEFIPLSHVYYSLRAPPANV